MEQRSVLERAMRLLRTFDAEHRLQTASQLSRRTGIPLSTTHRIAMELVETGALERDSTGQYRVGLRLWEIAAAGGRPVSLQRLALPYMQDLFETTHYPVHLAIREKTEVVFIERLEPPDSDEGGPRVGDRRPLPVTAVGLVLLAYAPVPIQNEVLATPFTAFSSTAETDPQRIRQILADVRREGTAVSDRRAVNGFVAVGAPIFDPYGEIIAAISLIIPAAHSQGPYPRHLVRASAMSISRVCGADSRMRREYST